MQGRLERARVRLLAQWAPPGSVYAPFPEEMWPAAREGGERLVSYRVAWTAMLCETIYFTAFSLCGVALIVTAIAFLAEAKILLAALGAGTLIVVLAALAGMACTRFLGRRERRLFNRDPIGYNLYAMGGPSRLPAREVGRIFKDSPAALEVWARDNGLDAPAIEAFEAMAGEWSASTDDLVRACRAL